jgi:hypothetical protein
MNGQFNKRYLNIKIIERQYEYVIKKVTTYKPNIQKWKHHIWNHQDRQCTYGHGIEASPPNHSWRGKAVSITYSECIFVV